MLYEVITVTDPAALDALNANATTFLPYPENGVASSFGIEDGSFLRLSTITVGYTGITSYNVCYTKLLRLPYSLL